MSNTDYIWEYYRDKRKTENEDTAIQMTLNRFWFNKKTLEYFVNRLEDEE